MKTFFTAILGILITTTNSIGQSANTQTPSMASNNAKATANYYNASTADTMDKTAVVKPTVAIQPRALKDLEKHYKQAANIYWLKAKGGGSIAGFISADIRTWVTYNKKGNWMYAIKRYDASKLPKQVKTDIEYAYPKYTLLGAEEITVPQKLIYLVHIFKGTNLTTLRICEGDIEELDTFNGYQESH